MNEPLLCLKNTTDILLVWNVFSKCKNNIENGHRLENMTWRIWYKQKQTMSLEESFSKLQANTVAKAVMEKEMEKIVKNSIPYPPTTNIVSINNAVSTASTGQKESDLKTTPILKKLETNSNQKKVSVKYSISTNLPAKPSPIAKVKGRKPTFFISESCTSTLSDESFTDESDNDSIYSSDLGSESDCEEEVERSIFSKQQLPAKRPSLLSIALQRDAFRNSQTQLAARKSEVSMGRTTTPLISNSKSETVLGRDDLGFIMPSKAIDTVPHKEHIGSSMSPDKDLTESLKMNLGLDHARMFNTVFETGRNKEMSIDHGSTRIW